MIARARPLLGTIVSMRADCGEGGIASAFAAVERVHALMNFHSSEGDVARINRDGCRGSVKVDPWTFRVLKQARAMSEQSGGAFDVTVPGTGASWADVELAAGSRVRLRKPGCVDLGGIAKGFAVDMAVEALLESGAQSGCVNAGGDLRSFGEAPSIRVRVPGQPLRAVFLPRVAHRAFATSASYFGGRVNDRRKRHELALGASITVAANTCMIADALTKAVALLGPEPSLLRTWDACAFAVDANGDLHAARA